MIDLTFAAIIGFLTVIIAVLVKIIGLPDQIRKNYKRKSTEGISTAFFVLAFFSYLLWTLHGINQADYVLIIGQGFGVITTAIIAFQIILYRKVNK